MKELFHIFLLFSIFFSVDALVQPRKIMEIIPLPVILAEKNLFYTKT